MTKNTTKPAKPTVVQSRSSADALFDDDDRIDITVQREVKDDVHHPTLIGPPVKPPTLEDAVDTVIKRSAKSAQLEQAWATLESVLTKPVRIVIETTATNLRIPKWQLILGLINHLHQSSTLSNPVIDPSWRDAESMLTIGDEIKCPECGVMFEQQWPRQIYCSTKCGTAKLERDMNKRRADALELKKQADKFTEEEIRDLLNKKNWTDNREPEYITGVHKQ